MTEATFVQDPGRLSLAALRRIECDGAAIVPEDLEEMQSRLLLSNAAGTGALLSEAVVRLTA